MTAARAAACPPRVDTTEYIARLSHELRTPLTSITAFAELLRDCDPPLAGEALEFVDIIEDNSRRLLQLIADLQLITRMESGTLQPDFAPVPLPEVIGEAIRASSADAARRGVSLEVAPSAHVEGPTVLADRQLLLRLLASLLSNAIKFTEPPGQVTVSWSHDGTEWRTDVTDSGIGIPAEEQGKLFDHFFRASNARLAQRPGAGLGLCMARAITGLHHGRIQVRSALRHGTTVSFWLRSRP